MMYMVLLFGLGILWGMGVAEYRMHRFNVPPPTYFKVYSAFLTMLAILTFIFA